MKRSTAITSLCLCGAVAAAFALTRGQEVPAQEVVAEATAPPLASAEPSHGMAASTAPSRSMRMLVAAAVAQATRHVDPSSLDDYLATLEARARTQGRVTALELEPGLAMIRRHDPTGDRLVQFARRMQALQRELAGDQESTGASAPTARRPEALSASIADADNEAERQAAVRAYLEAARERPPDGEAVAELNQLTSGPSETSAASR